MFGIHTHAIQAFQLCVTIVITVFFMLCIQKLRDRFRQKHFTNTIVNTMTFVLFGVVRLGVFIGAIIIVLHIFNIDVTSMLAGIGIAGVIIGFALQDTLKNIIMGVHIISDHFFAVGEYVEYEGEMWTVIGFNLHTTKLGNAEDHSIITVNNGDIKQIHRYARRLEIDVPTPHDVPSDVIIPTLLEVCRRASELKDVEKCEFIGLEKFTEYCIVYRLRVFGEPKYHPENMRAVNAIVRSEFETKGIRIPINSMNVYMK